MHEHPQPIPFDLYRARAKRLRAEAIDGLFRRLAALVLHRRPQMRQAVPTLRLVSR